MKINFIKVFSRENKNSKFEKGYIQDIVIKYNIDLKDTQVYACGSEKMINSASDLLCKKNLEKDDFYADAFVQTN